VTASSIFSAVSVHLRVWTEGSYTKTLPSLLMGHQTSALDILQAFPKRIRHVRVAQNLEALDQALVELPRENGKHGPAALGDLQRLVRRFPQALGQVEKSLSGLGDREDHVSLLMDIFELIMMVI